MTPTDATEISEILIVAAGAVLTLVLGGALVYWIDQECRGPAALRSDRRGAGRRDDAPRHPPVQRPPEA